MAQARKLTAEELAEKDAVDLLRTLVRFKHRRAMRHELNEFETAMVSGMRAALEAGEPYSFSPKAILERLDG